MVKQMKNLKSLISSKLAYDPVYKFKLDNSRENVIKVDSDDSNTSILDYYEVTGKGGGMEM